MADVMKIDFTLPNGRKITIPEFELSSPLRRKLRKELHKHFDVNLTERIQEPKEI